MLNKLQPSSREEFQPDSLTRGVLNLEVTFYWVSGGDRLWFKRQTRTGEELVVLNAETGEEFQQLDPTEFDLGHKQLQVVISPDGRSMVLRRENDLWLKNLSSGQESRLTYDGEPHFGYGDVDPSYERQGVARRRAHAEAPLRGVLWSPDGRFILALRQDLRALPERAFVTEYASPDKAYAHVHVRRISVASAAKVPSSHVVAFDTITGTIRVLALDPQSLNDLALPYFVEGIVWWGRHERAERLFLITANRGGTRFSLVSVDCFTGQVKKILTERAHFNVRMNPFDYARPNVYVTSDGTEIIWYSERSGHGHLYLYKAASGQLVRQLTHGDWVVFDLLHVDEAQRIVYFTGATRDFAGDPYYRYLYRISFDGGEPKLLTPEIADHQFSNLFFRGAYRYINDGTDVPQPGSSIAPNGRYFVDAYSSLTQPPEYVLRRSSGESIRKILMSDASDLYKTGWRPAERVITKASDGTTDLYAIIVKPRDFDPARKYPVIDSMYPGPQGSFVPRAFVDQLVGGSIHHLQTFADAGFIVIAIDGRGTAHRSRAFRDAFLGTEDVFGAADHVAALQYLSKKYPYLDLIRVGVRGQSFGGYGSLRAMLLFPDFFKVCVSATGPSGFLDLAGQMNVERFFGVPSESIESTSYYDSISNHHLVSRLEGHALLIYGGIDESVPLKHALVMLDAFIKADKDVDMLIIPEAAHSVPKDPYVIRRSVRYFVQHLVG